MNIIPASITTNNDWHPYHMHDFYKPNPKINYVDGRYVTDILTEEVIDKWLTTYSNHFLFKYVDWPPRNDLEKYHWPVIISAQMCKGKNHFILRLLRKYAQNHGNRILVLGNRVALDYQQKKELAKLCGYHLQYDLDEKWKEKSEFGNITVLTYHKLAAYMKDTRWCRKFTFVVLDECHYFFS